MSEVRPSPRRFGKVPSRDPLSPTPLVWLGLIIAIIVGTPWGDGIWENGRSLIGILACVWAYSLERNVVHLRKLLQLTSQRADDATTQANMLLQNSIDLEQMGWLAPDGTFIPINQTNGVKSWATPPDGSEPVWRLPGPASRVWNA